MEREKEFRRRDMLRKAIYFLLSFFVYGICYTVLVGIVEAVNLLYVISPYIRIVLYLVFFFIARFLTVRIMNMKWVGKILLQL